MINFYCNHDLKNTLQANEVESYAPAYSGESAGLDLYNSGPSVTIKPVSDFSYQNKILIPTGLRVIVPEGYVALIQERGSITKTPLKVRAGVIDRGYTGEIFVNAVNVSQNEFTIRFLFLSFFPLDLIKNSCFQSSCLLDQSTDSQQVSSLMYFRIS